MLLHIGFVCEILASIICINSIYGEKVRLNVNTWGIAMCLLLVLEIINYNKYQGLFSVIVYVILFIYCRMQFKSARKESIVSVILYILLMSILQFICFLPINILISVELIRNIVGNSLLLFFSVAIFSKFKLVKIQKMLLKMDLVVVCIIGFVSLIVISMLLQGKILYMINAQQFILLIPAIILLIYITFKWFYLRIEKERLEKNISRIKENTEEYENLITKIRLRQHEFQNHMAAILSTKYVYENYDEVLEAQEEYCGTLLHANKYNKLVLLGDKVLAGFLYGKIEEAEARTINVTCNISAKVDNCRVPSYLLVEMLGILLDNAIEAQNITDTKQISIEVSKQNCDYVFAIGNPFPYISYNEMEKWFSIGKSTKGRERGLGLYHLKCLANEQRCLLECRNVNKENRNWIYFVLKMGKADN